MHGITLRTSVWLVLAAFASGLSGCAVLAAKKHTYLGESRGLPLNGAKVRMQVKPEGESGGSYALSAMIVSAATGTMDGPFRWRFIATGITGRHERLIVHRIETRTSKTKRHEAYPAEKLGRCVDFRRVKANPAQSRAKFEVPGLLLVKPRVDGALDVRAFVSIAARGKRESRWLEFHMDPTRKDQREFVFIPAEIVKSIGASPADWDDTGWD